MMEIGLLLSVVFDSGGVISGKEDFEGKGGFVGGVSL